MLLSQVFLPQFIKVAMEANTKEEAFEELVGLFCSVTQNPKQEEILEALREREAKMTTGVHPGIAIPHGKTTAVDHSYGILGVSSKGVDYDSLDNKPVHIIFMELAPPVEAEKHLTLLKLVAEILRNPLFYNEALAQKTVAGVYETLKKYEDTGSE
jgi:PTS system fructose-specific IIC component/PTS system nitrogen regulatory IIA component